jgi:hypothetical protein
MNQMNDNDSHHNYNNHPDWIARASHDITTMNTFKQSAFFARAATTVGTAVAAASLMIFLGSGALPALADEYGRETEAPTFGTGENLMICTKRGPLGACLKTELRTADNENDVSLKYFREPTALVKKKDDEARAAETTEGNALIERLKQKTEENREKNELIVKQKTLMNDAVSVVAFVVVVVDDVVVVSITSKSCTIQRVSKTYLKRILVEHLLLWYSSQRVSVLLMRRSSF